MNNDYMMYFLLTKNNNLSEIKYHNNLVEYQGKIIDISNIFVGDLMNHDYDALPKNQGSLSAEEFFCILDTNAAEIEPKRGDIKNLNNMALTKLLSTKNKLIINPERYFELLNKEQLTDEEYQQITDFETEVSQCMKYCDYLLPNKKTFMDDYYNRILNLQFQFQEEPTKKLTQGEEHAISKYDGMLEAAKNHLVNIYKRELKPTENVYQSAGYANAFIVLLSTIATGIITAITLYLTIK